MDELLSILHQFCFQSRLAPLLRGPGQLCAHHRSLRGRHRGQREARTLLCISLIGHRSNPTLDLVFDAHVISASCLCAMLALLSYMSSNFSVLFPATSPFRRPASLPGTRHRPRPPLPKCPLPRPARRTMCTTTSQLVRLTYKITLDCDEIRPRRLGSTCGLDLLFKSHHN